MFDLYKVLEIISMDFSRLETRGTEGERDVWSSIDIREGGGGGGNTPSLVHIGLVCLQGHDLLVCAGLELLILIEPLFGLLVESLKVPNRGRHLLEIREHVLLWCARVGKVSE